MGEIIRVRRNTNSHVFHGLWVLYTFYRTWDSELPFTYFWGLSFAISIVLILRVLIKNNYLEIKDSRLTINGDFFNTQTTEISEIERIQIEAGPFGRSKIFLKDKKKIIKFNYRDVDNKEFKILLKHLGVPVT
jgi:hypothetical protein